MPSARRRPTPAERRERFAAVDDPAVVLAAALRYLESRARAVHELRRHLVGAGYRESLVDGAISRLSDLGLLDDARFAASWIASRERTRPRGALALRRELVQRGVPDDVIAAALAARETPSELDEWTLGRSPVSPHPDATAASGEDVTDESADTRAAERLLARRASGLLRVADPRARRARAYGLLARNGFPSGVATDTVAAAMRPGGLLTGGDGMDGPDDAPADGDVDPTD